MKIVFFGTTDYSARMLEALISAGHDISLVVTLPDRPSRRGHKPIPTPVAKLAQKEGLTLMKVKNMHNEDLVRRVKEADSDLGVVVAFKILPVEVFGAPRLGKIFHIAIA